jgi:DNA-binding PadR family transcriptional regulator
MKDLPRQTSKIFEVLSKGYFINSNSNDPVQRELYGVTEAHRDELEQYFKQIGFELEQGDEYFYFSRKEDKAAIERKIKKAYDWIDILDFFKTFNNGFAPGYRFYTSQLVEETRVNGLLRNKLNELGSQQEGTAKSQIDKILGRLERDGFIEKVDEFTETWKVTAALHYLERLILAIEVPEENGEGRG